MQDFDYIVVGSGATGAIAAKTLVERGKNVAVLDAGIWEEKYRNIIPDQDWLTIRKTDTNQHRYFLGDNFEGVVWEESRVGSQLTPPRNYLKQSVEELMPFVSETFFPFESLAKGGLGGGWGTGCFAFSTAELEKCGLNPTEIKKAYNQVSELIGISGQHDDSGPYSLGEIENAQAPISMEKSIAKVYSNYQKQKAALNKDGFFMGRSAIALLTQDLDDRQSCKKYDMEFWADKDKSAYRSLMTIDSLKAKPNFDYLPGWLVLSFQEVDGWVNITARNISDNSEQTFRCRQLVLAAGVLSTARIVLRSGNQMGIKLPVLCNPYSYMPTMQLAMLGNEPEQFKTGIGQAALFHDPNKTNFDVAQSALFSYRQLLLFKLAKETPLGFAFGRQTMKLLQSAFVIAGIHHPEVQGPDKWIKLEKSDNPLTGDTLTGEYLLSEKEKERMDWRETQYRKALRTLGCFPLKTIRTPQGGSIHYAGTLPFSDSDKSNSLSVDGKLNGYKNVWVADGSGFSYLPAKGLTLTLMANAANVCSKI